MSSAILQHVKGIVQQTEVLRIVLARCANESGAADCLSSTYILGGKWAA